MGRGSRSRPQRGLYQTLGNNRPQVLKDVGIPAPYGNTGVTSLVGPRRSFVKATSRYKFTVGRIANPSYNHSAPGIFPSAGRLRVCVSTRGGGYKNPAASKISGTAPWHAGLAITALLSKISKGFESSHRPSQDGGQLCCVARAGGPLRSLEGGTTWRRRSGLER